MDNDIIQPALIFENDWGEVEIIPRENYDNQLAGYLALREQQKDIDFSPHGWSETPFIIPVASIGIVSRNIKLDELKAQLIPPLVSSTITAKITTSETSPDKAIEPPGTFAFAATGLAVIYGHSNSGIVEGLSLHSQSFQKQDLEPILIALCKIGTAHNLILTDWNKQELIDLSNAPALRRYLQDL